MKRTFASKDEVRISSSGIFDPVLLGGMYKSKNYSNRTTKFVYYTSTTKILKEKTL